MTYYPNQAGESSDTACVSEGHVGCAHEPWWRLRCLTGRKQAGRRALRSAGWLQGVCHALRRGSPVWRGSGPSARCMIRLESRVPENGTPGSEGRRWKRT